MAEYIEKKAALDAIWQGCGACAEELEQLPVVEIVRCGECRKSSEDSGIFPNYWCKLNERVVKPDEFCSWAERKDNGRPD